MCNVDLSMGRGIAADGCVSLSYLNICDGW